MRMFQRPSMPSWMWRKGVLRMENRKVAKLYASVPPTEEQEARFTAFVKRKYGENVEFAFVEDPSIESGFRLEYDNEVYNWTLEGRMQQLQDAAGVINRAKIGKKHQAKNLISLFRSSLENWQLEAIPVQEGRVESVGDGIVFATGLESVRYGEIVLFESGVKGMVLDLRQDEVGIILFGEDDALEEGSIVRRTKKTAGIPVGKAMLGRVVNALGEPIDGLGEIAVDGYREMESPAPGIIDRQPVDEPMETGILSIDSMFPIGRGQRELIIGDRQTGKTAIAMDTILNQKGKGVVCIYCAIGQKASSVAQLTETLRRHGAMDYTIIVAATAAESTSLQYVAPYAATAVGEFFMAQGKDVLIIYDDLSKHAVAYRAISLLLERSPGREAFPGDVFYLHSRLLERSAHLSSKKGGGSMTALPIVETQAGDVSAYIPTNIISITDGQLFLESNLFFAGQRPAINVGLSVSRVGGAAQTKAMKKAVSGLRLDLAQYREMEVFTQFSSDLDEGTKRQLAYGQRLMRLLRQPQNGPFSMAEQVVMLVAAMAHKMDGVPVEEIQKKRMEFLSYMHDMKSDLLDEITSSRDLTDEVKIEILKAADKFFEINDPAASEQATS
ncbi:MAG: F0F1 ATP synthase subunit alpha [Eubacterium sp.]|nr:F0F1 ATP synthase subunit alpha [Eubacterium sp.]